MITKIVILILLVAIILTLASGLYFLVKDTDDKTRLVKALTIRVALSVVLIVFLLIAFMMGWIAPHISG